MASHEVVNMKKTVVLPCSKCFLSNQLAILASVSSVGLSSAVPYLSLYVVQLGINYKELGTIFLFLPISALLGPALSGITRIQKQTNKGIFHCHRHPLSMIEI